MFGSCKKHFGTLNKCIFIVVRMAGHSETTFGRVTQGVRPMTPDDYHITVRMGTSRNCINLASHLYVNAVKDPNGRLLRYKIMPDSDRSFVGGCGRTLWIWSSYYRDTVRYPRPGWAHIKPPFTVKPGKGMPQASDGPRLAQS